MNFKFSARFTHPNLILNINKNNATQLVHNPYEIHSFVVDLDAWIIAKKDMSEKDVLTQAKNIKNIKKNLKDKRIIKNIFVKNKIINFITT